MADKNWWFNRTGQLAPVSNPGSAVPNYGLTYDLATAPAEADEFDEMARGISAYLGVKAEGSASVMDKTWWDHATGAAGFVGDQAAGALGFLKAGVAKIDQHMPEAIQLEATRTGENADLLSADSWDEFQDIGKAEAAETMGEISESPGAEQIFWGLEKLNEYSSTAFVAATLSEDDPAAFLHGGTWGDAHELTKERRLNAGEAFVQMFYDKEVILDEERFEQLRQHNTVFNTSALAFNVIAAWKMDPNVLAGKQIGAARDRMQGKLATSGRTREVQRDILSAPSTDEALARADQYTSLADRLRANHSLSLYDRSLQLREAAQSMGFEEFKNLPAFRHSASGVTMAKLMKDVASNPDDWNLVFRSTIGDPDAIGELAAKQGAVADKIAAIEMRSMPTVEADLARVEMRYAKRLAEQGRPQDARIEITRFGDKWLDDEVTTLRAEAETLTSKLATYESHESWLQRALPGLDAESGLVDRNTPNAVFAGLDRLGGKGAIRSSLPSLGGKVKMWQHDDYSPVSWALRAPTKPFLKRVGVVSLNDVEDGASAVTSYLNQRDYLSGVKDQGYRDRILERWAGATTDIERKAVVEHVHKDAIVALGRKHGLSDEIMDKLADHLKEQRGLTWSRMSDATMYSPIRGPEGRLIEYVDDGGNMARVKMPVDPTQLPNYYPLVNLTDLDRAIRENRDVLRSLDTDLASRRQAGAAWTKRHAMEFVDEIGTTFNSFWKPLALISVRWPMRVVADESMRVMLFAGAWAHMAHLGTGTRNMAWNHGVVRPYEWWNGRKIKTGSLSEQALRSGARNDFDPYDYRAITNPTATMPIDQLDLGKMDKRRYERLNALTSERWRHLRSVEAGNATDTPRWASRWDEMLAAAETSGSRGFFFDASNFGRQSNKGFAVSAYPGRLRTFEAKPSAREMNYWIEKNSDLLAVPNNRVAVWSDADTGRWHLDVVKTTKQREGAMELAARLEATEFFDIEDGFSRYVDEDFTAQFAPVRVPDEPPTVAFDQAPVMDAADEIGAAIGGATGKPGLMRKKVGFGSKSWKTRDGRVVKGEQVFGPDTKNPNVYYGVVSSHDAIRNLYGGHTKAIGQDRASRMASDYKVWDPEEPGTNLDEWASAYAHFVNNHIRYSPIAQRMLDGQSDDEIYDWLFTAKGRQVRKRMGIRGENPGKWVSDIREIFDHMFPTERALQAARMGEVDPKQVPNLIPEGERPSVHGDTIKMGLGTSAKYQKLGWVVDKLMSTLGSMPTDALVRHPFAQTVYNREMRNYLSSVPAEKVTNNVLAAAEASARAEAVKRVRKMLYNIADEREGVHMLRFVSPFFQAQVEVLERYAHLAMEKPETVARIAQLLVGSQVVNTPLWDVTDREGKKAKGYDAENIVTFQVTDTMRELADHIPGLKGALDKAGEVTVPVSSLNLVLQGENPFLPSMGPLVSYPASEFVFKDRPELEGSAIYQWMFPFGTPRGDTFFDRGINTLAPAYMRRALTVGEEDLDDPAYARRIGEVHAQLILEWENGGREGKRPSAKQAMEAVNAEYRLRAASSFFLPAPVTPRSPYQFWIDQYRAYQEKYGTEANEKFYDEYGPSYYMFAQRATEAAGGMAPTTGSKKAYDRYKELAQAAPDLIGVLTGPWADGEFSDAVYNWQLNTPVTPGSSTNLRERLSPEERIAHAEVGRGWVEYGKLMSAIDAEVRNRVAQGGSAYLTATANADLAEIKEAKIREIIERNPAWQDDYGSRSSNLGSWLEQAYTVSFDESLDGREDIEALRAYLISRARLQDALIQREASGQASSDQLSFDPLGNPVGDNADLAMAWQGYVNELKSKNLLFEEIYNRYLEDDNLSTYIPPEVTGG